VTSTLSPRQTVQLAACFPYAQAVKLHRARGAFVMNLELALLDAIGQRTKLGAAVSLPDRMSAFMSWRIP